MRRYIDKNSIERKVFGKSKNSDSLLDCNINKDDAKDDSLKDNPQEPLASIKSG